MIYLDYNATTPLSSAPREAMLPYLDRFFGNASSVHAAGRQARAAIDNARDRIAALIGAKPNEIVFTGGGTEANNLAVLGLARAHATRGKHIVSCRTEHHAVLNGVEELEREGFQVSWIEVDRDGLIDLDQLRSSLGNQTILVSVMTANNETGVIQPMAEISAICREAGVLLHSDMVQSFGKIKTDLRLVDAASFAAHKFYGPKGAGFLYLRSGLSVQPIMFGGAHENQRRPGTEDVAAIVGMAEAAAHAQLDDEEVLEGVCASSGSACMVGSVTPSHVLMAMGLSRDDAGSAVRFSLGKPTTEAEIEQTIAIIGKLARRWQEVFLSSPFRPHLSGSHRSRS
jgi:cysteine desulfurase